MRPDVAVIGGGIAGLSAAWRLARRGQKVTLLEKEALLGAHATGKNAAIFRRLEGDAEGAALAQASERLLAELEAEAMTPLLRRTGALYLGQRSALEGYLRPGANPAAELLAADECVRRAPFLEGGDAEAGLWLSSDGVLDLHGLVQALARAAQRAGAHLRTGARVRALELRAGRVEGLTLADGTVLGSGKVVLAAGAWSAGLRGGGPLALVPRRRHLAMLAASAPVPAESPVVWRLDDEVYFRPETGGLLASPCDEHDWPAEDPPPSPEALELLARRLARVAPPLSRSQVKRHWACLRTFAPDRQFVVGEDPLVQDLYWLGGLGGRGMSCGLGLGELLAQTVGRTQPPPASLSASRYGRRA